ncbi:unnamed protein product [Sympodiomycopsis kandeliae]
MICSVRNFLVLGLINQEEREETEKDVFNHRSSRRPSPLLAWILLASAIGYLCYTCWTSKFSLLSTQASKSATRHPSLPSCPAQPDPLAPPDDTWRPEDDVEWLRASAQRLGDAVRIATVSEDDMKSSDLVHDPRYESFGKFREHLKTTYPEFHNRYTQQAINHHGLLYEIKGSDPTLKPGLFLAHQDVVPVPVSTVDEWSYPPFSGHYQVTNNETGEGYVWGRGSSDDKNMLIGIFEAFEQILQSDQDWQPARSFFIASGFDEEIGGKRGAGSLGRYLSSVLKTRAGDEEGYPLEFVLDEGGLGLGNEVNGVNVAQVALAEKGYIDLKLELKTFGGHSSIPSDHTAIGILAKMLVLLEQNLWPPVLDVQNPMLTYYSCLADEIDKKGYTVQEGEGQVSKYLLTSQFIKELHAGNWSYCADEIASKGSAIERYLLTTSQAIDVISGGDKVNALPEHAGAIINHRIRMGSNGDDVVERVKKVIQPVVDEFNLNYNGSIPSVNISIEQYSAPTKISSPSSSAYQIFSSTIKHVFGNDTLVTPSIMTGNTDSRHFLHLSENVWRWNPNRFSMQSNKHTINEKMSIKAHAETARFVWTFVKNMQR